jgi:hypothetical protein
VGRTAGPKIWDPQQQLLQPYLANVLIVLMPGIPENEVCRCLLEAQTRLCHVNIDTATKSPNAPSKTFWYGSKAAFIRDRSARRLLGKLCSAEVAFLQHSFTSVA